jgi:hypothetical protein
MKTANRTRPNYDDTVRLEASHIVQRLYFEKPKDAFALIYYLVMGFEYKNQENNKGIYLYLGKQYFSFRQFLYDYLELLKSLEYNIYDIERAEYYLENKYNQTFLDTVCLDIHTLTSARISVSDKNGSTQMYIPFQNFHVIKEGEDEDFC